MSEYQPDNWMEILNENMSLEWIKSNARFYILNHRDKSASALIWKARDTNDRGWHGVRLKREYLQSKGYYMEFEPMYTDVQWSLEQNDSKDITANFDEAVSLANQHGK